MDNTYERIFKNASLEVWVDGEKYWALDPSNDLEDVEDGIFVSALAVADDESDKTVYEVYWELQGSQQAINDANEVNDLIDDWSKGTEVVPVPNLTDNY